MRIFSDNIRKEKTELYPFVFVTAVTVTPVNEKIR